jgi:transposase InsO family protein
MPWKEVSLMSARTEFLEHARQPGANITHLAQRFGIARKTASKWLARDRAGQSLRDGPRKPHSSPKKTPPELEERVLKLREQYPTWGGRKLRALLLQQSPGVSPPAASTITAILRRHGQLDGPRAGQPRDWQRFEHPAPNDLWQMDFKGHFPLADGRRCHPLTVLDDHSRFVLGLVPCANEQGETVQKALRTLFARYGLPTRMLMDNGPPWGDPHDQLYTRLTVWLMELGIRISHGRPYHPQTQGKDERFHRTLNTELLHRTTFADFVDCADRFAVWLTTYNTIRPHESLGLQPPIHRYRFSPRFFADPPPKLVYDESLDLRWVQGGGVLWYREERYFVPRALIHRKVGLHQPGPTDPIVVWFGPHRLGELDPVTRKLVRRHSDAAANAGASH